MTVGGYYLSTRDFEAFLEQILGEFNEKIPKLTPEYLSEFLKILFRKEDDLLIFKNSKSKDTMKDFHIVLALFMKHMGQGWNDIKDMPYELFEKIYEDLKIIIGDEKYDENRNSERPDKKALKKEF